MNTTNLIRKIAVHPPKVPTRSACVSPLAASLRTSRQTSELRSVTTGKAEPDVAAAPRRIVVVTKRRTAALAEVEPRATAQHPALACFRP